MASILQLKRRIKAAQNVSKTTKAMQMIAASKLKKAQEAALSARPYVEKLTLLSQTIANVSSKEEKHPYMQQFFDTKKSLLVVLSPDKGLCGGLITNLLREFLKYNKGEEGTCVVVGKKLEGYVAKFGKEVLATFQFGTTLPTFDLVFPIVRIIDEYYLAKKVDTVKILSSRFSSIFTQVPEITTIVPVSVPKNEDAVSTQNNTTYLFEPNPQEILPELLKHYLEMTVYQKMLESFLSEQASRMIAMQNATSNANDIIDDLRLEYNKTRQAKITSEILDITGARRVP